MEKFLHAGAKYNAAQFWFFADHNVLKNNSNYARPYNREVLKVRTSNLAEGAQNQDNRQHAQVTFDVFDEQDRQGLFISCNIATVRDGINFIEARVVMTWDLPVYGGEYNTYSSY